MKWQWTLLSLAVLASTGLAEGPTPEAVGPPLVTSVTGGNAPYFSDAGCAPLFPDRFGVLRNRVSFAGQREGWLNLGGFAQYTVIADEPGQFLLTAGMRWEAPSGSKAIFQGIGPVHLAPYVTAGKEFGDFHV